jgi:anti-repressor protein
MGGIIPISYEGEMPTVLGRALHEWLGVETEYPIWMERMAEYGFEEGQDFNSFKFEEVRIEGTRRVTRSLINHDLSIPMAKEISMLQRTDKGKEARQYFIKVEEAWNSPEMVMSRALQLAQRNIEQLNDKVAAMLPKAAYFDNLVERNLLTNFRDTAKEFGIKPKVFIQRLINDSFIYRDPKGDLRPYSSPKTEGLFEIKEWAKPHKSGVQTLITPKGRETLRLLYAG